MAKFQFNGPVGQVVKADVIGSVRTKITMGDDGEMIVESEITTKDGEEE